MGKASRRNHSEEKRKPPTSTEDIVERLRERLSGLQSLAEFERYIQGAAPERRPLIRSMCRPLIPPNLPCCGPAYLATYYDRPMRHSPFCPERDSVTGQPYEQPPATPREGQESISATSGSEHPGDAAGTIGVPATED